MRNLALHSVARTLVAKGKGILAADESFGTIAKRFDALGIASTEESRRAYREMLFTTPGMEAHLSGVILFDETIRQAASDGTPLVRILTSKGVLPGIKVDQGTEELGSPLDKLQYFPGERITRGLEGLGGRLVEYRRLGALFAKWRAVFSISDRTPSTHAINENAHVLARYAVACQEAGLVPIVEPEVLMDGDHDIHRCEVVTTTVLEEVFAELERHHAHLEGLLLKPSMVLPGRGSPDKATTDQIAEATLRCLGKTVPGTVPGIAFLSGGQGPEVATLHLNAMNLRADVPWELSFSFGRALQEPCLREWCGEPARVSKAQAVFLHRCRCNGAARSGSYLPSMESVEN